MMTAMLIDDEIVNVDIISNMLERKHIFDKIYKYTESELAMEQISTIKPDVVFTDIEMPNTNGMELAGRINEIHPEAKVIFVTSYDKYAVEAFELYALDYIIKPIRLERLEKTIKRIIEKKARQEVNNIDKIKVTIFGKLEISKGIKHIHWQGSKTAELFAYMLDNFEKSIHKDELIDILWPDFEYKRASANMQTAMCRVRKSLSELGNEIKIEYSCGYYKMVMDNVYFDKKEFESLTSEFNVIDETNLLKAIKIIEMYKGDYLEKEGYIWSYNRQIIMRRIYEGILKKTVRYYCRNDKLGDAIILLEQVITDNPNNCFAKRLLKKIKINEKHIL